ncbi:hypothetical protein AGMMS50267_08440 [Spirochaetia bacterium]|nr:hypothetical protein AGMMS50267_08440 [Spirochaetia bacterium]
MEKFAKLIPAVFSAALILAGVLFIAGCAMTPIEGTIWIYNDGDTNFDPIESAFAGNKLHVKFSGSVYPVDYQWLKDGKPIGSDLGYYTVKEDDVGGIISVRVTGAENANFSGTLTSTNSVTILEGDISCLGDISR